MTAAGALLAGTSNAAILALYTFESGAGSTDTELSTTASSLTSGITGSFSGNITQNNVGLEIHTQHTNAQVIATDKLTFDSPVTGSALVGAYSDIKSGSNSLAGALGKNQYVSFTVTLGGASSIDLTSFNFVTDITKGITAKNYWLLADVVGGTFAAGDLIGSGNFTTNDSEAITSFSTSSFSSDTEFRLYLDTGASTSSHGFALDNITLEGTITPVPEPSAALLGGLGMLVLLRRRR